MHAQHPFLLAASIYSTQHFVLGLLQMGVLP
jgi:hypothetical protein